MVTDATTTEDTRELIGAFLEFCGPEITLGLKSGNGAKVTLAFPPDPTWQRPARVNGRWMSGAEAARHRQGAPKRTGEPVAPRTPKSVPRVAVPATGSLFGQPEGFQ